MIKETSLHLLALKVTFRRKPSLAEAKSHWLFRSETKVAVKGVNIAFKF